MAPNDDAEPRTDAGDAIPGAGHNRPPAPLSPTEVPFYLAEENAGLLKRRAELVEGLRVFHEKHPTIETDDVMAAATENMEMIRRALNAVEERRKTAKEPFLEGGRAVDAWFAGIKTTLERAVEPLRGAAREFLVAKEKRLRAAAEAEAARLAAEAAEAEAAVEDAGDAGEAIEALANAATIAKLAEGAEALAKGKPGPLTRTTGSYGSTSSLQEVVRFEIQDVRKVPRQYCSPDERLILAAVRSGVRAITGVKIWVDRQVRTR